MIPSRFRSALTALLAAALAVGLLASPAQATPSAQAAPPVAGGTPISEVALEPYLPGEPSWPSSFSPSFALTVVLEAEHATPGGRFALELPDHLVVAAVPGEVVADVAGKSIKVADYRVDPDGRTVRFAFAPEVHALRGISARVALFANLDDVATDGGTFVGTARSGSNAFPLSVGIGPMSWRITGISSVWVPAPDGESIRLRIRAVVPGQAGHGADGGQWIGARTADTWPGRVRPVPGTTRLFAHDVLPETTDGLVDPAAAVPASSYAVAAEGQVPGTVTMGISIPAPRDGSYVVEQDFALETLGEPVLPTIPGSTLPQAAQTLFAAGTQVDTASVRDHAASGENTQGSSSLVHFVSSGAEATAAAAPPTTTPPTTTPPTKTPPTTPGGTGTNPAHPITVPGPAGTDSPPGELAATGSAPQAGAAWAMLALLLAGAACGTLGFRRAARGSRPGSAA